MSDTLLPDDPPEDRLVQLKRSQIRALEEQARGARDAEERAAKAERQLAFALAGISLSDPKLSYFVKGYDGDTTPEAIRQAAIDAGFIEAQDTGSTVPKAEHDAAQRIARATDGTEPPQPRTVTPDDIAKATTPEEVMALLNQIGASEG